MEVVLGELAPVFLLIVLGFILKQTLIRLDAPLLAQIITLQTILAAITMPVVIALAAAGP